jgi:hypothetical protein
LQWTHLRCPTGFMPAPFGSASPPTTLSLPKPHPGDRGKKIHPIKKIIFGEDLEEYPSRKTARRP